MVYTYENYDDTTLDCRKQILKIQDSLAEKYLKIVEANKGRTICNNQFIVSFSSKEMIVIKKGEKCGMSIYPLQKQEHSHRQFYHIGNYGFYVHDGGWFRLDFELSEDDISIESLIMNYQGWEEVSDEDVADAVIGTIEDLNDPDSIHGSADRHKQILDNVRLFHNQMKRDMKPVDDTNYYWFPDDDELVTEWKYQKSESDREVNFINTLLGMPEEERENYVIEQNKPSQKTEKEIEESQLGNEQKGVFYYVKKIFKIVIITFVILFILLLAMIFG